MPIAVFALLIHVAGAHAQSSTYEPWSPPPDGTQQSAAEMQELVDKLRALVDEADAARAADPNFLRDLRDLATAYDRSHRAALLFDDFRDGNFTAAPAWSVISGQFSVDPRYGLRSTVALQKSSTGSSQDAGAVLLQSILNQMVNPQGGTATSTTAGPAMIHATARIGNAFRAEIEFGSLVAGGRLAFGPSTYGDARGGYRVVYIAGAKPSLRLVALKRGEQAVIGSYELKSGLEDRKRHVIAWSRGASGAMTVALDGTPVITVTDRIFREGFAGFAITNPGGDFVVRHVLVEPAS
ncbi:MAG: hypothetical protein WD673_15105 [Alphaproteobacteria bacterium]